MKKTLQKIRNKENKTYVDRLKEKTYKKAKKLNGYHAVYDKNGKLIINNVIWNTRLKKWEIQNEVNTTKIYEYMVKKEFI